MQFAAPVENETIVALDQMKRSIRTAFCGVMQSTQLPPMAAMSLAATAVGLLYLGLPLRIAGTTRALAVGSRAAQPIWKRCRLRSRWQ